MKIAQIAPLMERCPPRLYGGTERIVSYLVDELVAAGHEVTLFASGDSSTRAELVPCCKVALRLDDSIRDPLPYHVAMLEEVRRRAHAFDVLHFHIDLLHFPLVQPFVERTLTTLHGRLDLPDLAPFHQKFPDMPLVSISHAQRDALGSVRWLANVPHGLPRDLLPFSARHDGYLAFLGRISPEKRPDLAIEIATRAGFALKIAAKIDNIDRAYWNEVVAPLVRAHPNVEYVGEIDEDAKAEFLGNAAALLFPIDWPEPFGLVMIEAMACGTPVVAFRRGSVPEVLDNGLTGFVVEGPDDAVAALAKIDTLDRAAVRRHFERHFTAARMAHDYVAVYERIGVSAGAASAERSAYPRVQRDGGLQFVA
jgi:glycosyltransferase involved in cell wall biosynthesis